MFFTVGFLLLISESTFCIQPLNFFDSNLALKHQRSMQQKYAIRRDVENDIYKLFVVKQKGKLLFPGDDAQVRPKRGIVLIDEDFDKLPDVSVQQGWSGGLTEQDPMDLVKEKEKVVFTESGSGEGSLQDEITTKLTNTTSAEVLITKLKTSKPTTFSDSTFEGSGDYDSTSILTSTVKVHDVFDYSNMMSCLNYSCAATELTISPGSDEAIPEDSNLILLCSMSNSTSGDLLQWYKNNGSDASLLSASVSNNQIQYVLSKATTDDSGEYVCVKRSKTSCCNRKFEVIFYKKPNYKYHLLIVGLVTVVSVFTCLLLAIHRRYKLRQYKKEINAPIQMNEFLL